MKTTISLAIRVYVDGSLKSEERMEASEANLEELLLPKLAEKHALLSAGQPTMIEFEFLDEANINERFWRIGSDPRRMVCPIAIELK